mgnify:CR=1 FL=1
MSTNNTLAVIALGGNAIIPHGDGGSFASQFANTEESMGPVADLLKAGYNLILTHGNGPQVGALMLQSEMAKEKVPEIPLNVADAMTCGSMGYMLEQALTNAMAERAVSRQAVTIPAQIVVDPDDPAMTAPSKPIGPFYPKEEAESLASEKGWVVKEDANRGYRRYVPSPYPVEVVEKAVVLHLVENGYVVITGGGGGIPVTRRRDGSLAGVDAVIDKDLASMKIGLEVGARLLIIITGVPKVTINFGTPEETALDRITLNEARRYAKEGQFPPGSMGPKIRAAIEFVEANPGNRVVITDVQNVKEAVEGTQGTWITA